MNRYRITTMGRDPMESEGATPEAAVVALMETTFSDYGRKWAAVNEPPGTPYYDITQRRRYVTHAIVTEIAEPTTTWTKGESE